MSKETNKTKQATKKAPRPKQLTMNKIKNEAKQAYKMEEYSINDKDEIIKFFPIFPQGRIDDLLKELREDLTYSAEKGIKLDEDDDFFISYIMFLCVKYFTSLEKGFSDKVEDKILQYEYLKDSGYFDIIVGDIFMESEKTKVIESLSKILGTQKFMEQIQQKTTDYIKTLEFRNKEIFDRLNSTTAEDSEPLDS